MAIIGLTEVNLSKSPPLQYVSFVFIIFLMKTRKLGKN